ncbi:hypothetical protein KI387_010679, partial [Taxus chinensis]
MGRKALDIEYIPDSRKRKYHFDKRIATVFKKAYEISKLCRVGICLGVEAEDGSLHFYRNNDIPDTDASLFSERSPAHKINLYNPISNKFEVPGSLCTDVDAEHEMKVNSLISELQKEIAPKRAEEEEGAFEFQNPTTYDCSSAGVAESGGHDDVYGQIQDNSIYLQPDEGLFEDRMTTFKPLRDEVNHE